jgi:hypothetical protein
MRRSLALVTLATATATAACSGPAAPVAAPGAAPSAAQPPPSATASPVPFDDTEPIPGLTYTPALACEMADAAYQELDGSSRRHVLDGAAAERAGDRAGVRRELAALKPLFTSVSATFADTAAKVTDPTIRSALESLAGSAGKAATFTTFAQFGSLAALTAPAEAVLKRECPKAGHPLRNIT